MAKSTSLTQEELRQVPAHIGIIMDGNGRWAKRRGLPRKMGHRSGAQAFREIAEYSKSIGVKYLTVYAFSTENWKRPKEEVDAIMDLLNQYLDEAFARGNGDHIRTKFIGDISALTRPLQERIARIQEESKNETAFTLNVALNYGGRAEMTHAVQEIAREIESRDLLPQEITEDTIAAHLYTKGEPDPDLIIRPSGEYRLSNFLMWQSAYSELVFMDVLWPDFKPRHLDEAIRQYLARDRRFGGV